MNGNKAIRQISYHLSETNYCHGIHSLSEGFTIIYFSQAEGLTASQVIEGRPTPLQPVFTVKKLVHMQ